MALVPFVFADQSGTIPLSQLDVNFANVKAFAETAGNVTGNIQANITAVGTLSFLNVTGNVAASAFVGNVIGNISGNITAPGANTQILFNDNGLASAVSGFSFNKSSNSLSITGNIFSNAVIEGNLLLTTSGNIGAPIGVSTFRLANLYATTLFIGGNATNVFIANTNSTTTLAGNATVVANLSVNGNVQSGNFLTSGGISATGNITSGNILLLGVVSSSGNVQGGNIKTSGLISATGNITGENILTTGVVSTTGNITGGNLLTAGIVSLTGNLTASGNTALSGNSTAITAANGTNSTQIATTAFVANAITNAALPAGIILLWSGSVVSIPAGWALCNGANGTPDLRDRFVVGAGSTYAVGATGGSANAVVVAHTHGATSSVSDPGHSHGYVTYASLQPQAGFTTNCWVGTANTSTTSNVTGISVTTTVASTGVSATNANLPPYYALAYIMKL